MKGIQTEASPCPPEQKSSFHQQFLLCTPDLIVPPHSARGEENTFGDIAFSTASGCISAGGAGCGSIPAISS